MSASKKLKHNTNNKRQLAKNRQANMRTHKLTFPRIQIIPDEERVELSSTISPAVYFNVASSAGSVDVYANSLANFIAGTGARVPYLKGFTENYQRYRVEKSEISVLIESREATKSQIIYVVPTIDNSAVNSITNLLPFQDLPFGKKTAVSPYVGGNAINNVSNCIDFVKLIGPHYKSQDEYAAIAANDPATLVYWRILFANPDNNTLSTGGVIMDIMLKQHIVFYQPYRGSNAD